tara:strand:- start:10765 stop:11556 length:792 start_codon:yes stop_codon:yes gene_type:complete
MATQTVDSLVSGGKATAAPPLGPALGPLGVNIGQVVQEINKKTEAFKGMQVPVKVVVDSDTKEFEITVGTPPASALIKKEVNLEKGSGKAKTDMVADILIEQIIKVALMKESNLLGKTLKDRVKEIVGTCQSMGILVEGKQPPEAIIEINNGKFDEEIRTEKTELSAEELQKLEVEKKKLAAEIEKRRAEYESTAKAIIAEMEGKERGEIKAKLNEAGIPGEIIKALLPDEAAVAEGAEGAPPAEGAEGEKKEEAPAEEKKEE